MFVSHFSYKMGTAVNLRSGPSKVPPVDHSGEILDLGPFWRGGGSCAAIGPPPLSIPYISPKKLSLGFLPLAYRN